MLSNARGKWVKTEAGRIQFAPFKIARNFWRRSFQFANFLPPHSRSLGSRQSYFKISREPWGELYWQDLREVPRHVSILFGIAIVLLFVGVTLPQSLCEQTALQGSSRASEADPNDRLAVGRNE